MKTFLDYYNDYKNGEKVLFSVYYIVKGKTPRVEESDCCTFRKYEKESRVSLCRLPKHKGGWMRNVVHTASTMYFGYFKEEDFNRTVLTDNWNHTHKTVYLYKEDAEKALKATE